MTQTKPKHQTWTHAEWLAELSRRFGPDPMAWAFICPMCGDVATGQDFKDALAAEPRTRADGTTFRASDLLGGQCIGWSLGALTGAWQGWRTDDGKRLSVFPMAPEPTRDETAREA